MPLYSQTLTSSHSVWNGVGIIASRHGNRYERADVKPYQRHSATLTYAGMQLSPDKRLSETDDDSPPSMDH